MGYVLLDRLVSFGDYGRDCLPLGLTLESRVRAPLLWDHSYQLLGIGRQGRLRLYLGHIRDDARYRSRR